MERLAKIYRENENFRLILKLFFILLMSRLFMLVLMVIYNVYMGTDRSIAFLMNQWDAKRYQFMIDNGYTFPLDTDPQANWAFFPMYVMVCRFVKMLTFGVMDTYWVGMTVSTVCIFIAAFTAVKYMSLVRGGRSEDYLLIFAHVISFPPSAVKSRYISTISANTSRQPTILVALANAAANPAHKYFFLAAA